MGSGVFRRAECRSSPRLILLVMRKIAPLMRQLPCAEVLPFQGSHSATDFFSRQTFCCTSPPFFVPRRPSNFRHPDLLLKKFIFSVFFE